MMLKNVFFGNYAARKQTMNVGRTYVRHIAAAKQDMVRCIADIEANCSSLRLKPNADKSELIVLGSRQQLSKISTSERDLQLPGGVLR